MTCCALIAIKSLSLGKERLAGVLTSTQREQLVRGMLDKVLHSLDASSSVERIAIVTPERLAVASNITLLPDLGGGLNASLAYGAQMLQAEGADELLVMHGDLPLVGPHEIDEIIALGRGSGIALAPDHHHQGTNAIYLKRDTGFEFHFGPASFQKHQAEAVSRGIIPAIASLPGFAFDIDEPGDLSRLPELRDAMYHFLINHGAIRHDHQCSPHSF